MTKPITANTANNVINASIASYFIILKPTYENIKVTNIPIAINNRSSNFFCSVTTDTILPTTNAVKAIFAKS